MRFFTALCVADADRTVLMRTCRMNRYLYPRSVGTFIHECGIALCEESAALVMFDILIGNLG